jgi:hypothetical protein
MVLAREPVAVLVQERVVVTGPAMEVTPAVAIGTKAAVGPVVAVVAPITTACLAAGKSQQKPE